VASCFSGRERHPDETHYRHLSITHRLEHRSMSTDERFAAMARKCFTIKSRTWVTNTPDCYEHDGEYELWLGEHLVGNAGDETLIQEWIDEAAPAIAAKLAEVDAAAEQRGYNRGYDLGKADAKHGREMLDTQTAYERGRADERDACADYIKAQADKVPSTGPAVDIVASVLRTTADAVRSGWGSAIRQRGDMSADRTRDASRVNETPKSEHDKGGGGNG
jgi:hypothetical protein